MLNSQKTRRMKTTEVKLGNKKYTLEVAETSKDRRKGLMGVKNLDEDKGMLFDFQAQ